MRRFNVVLACGWFLVSPPMIGDGRKIKADRMQPFSKWKIIGAIDTAKECGQEIAKAVPFAGRRPPWECVPTSFFLEQAN